MEFIFVLIIVITAIPNIKGFKTHLFSPWNITSIVWCIVYVLYKTQHILNPLTDQFFICCSLWILSFSITSRIQCKNRSTRKISIVSGQINSKILLIYYIIIMIGLPLYATAYLKIIGGFSFDALADIRNNAVNGEVYLGSLSFIPSLCKSVLLIELFLFTPKRKLNLTIAVIANIIAAIVIMEKGYLVFIFISLCFFLFEKKYIKIKTLLIGSICFFLLMCLFNYVRSMGAGGNIADFIALYFVSPSVAFCSINNVATDQWGEHTFRFFYAILNSIGIGPEAASNWYDPVYVPIKTNVFTAMEPYYHDFGTIGVLIFGIVNGFLCGKIYNQYNKRREPIVTCIYAYIVYMLISQFFQEYLFISLSVTLQIAICIFIATIQLRFKK